MHFTPQLKTLLTVLCATLYYRHRDLMLAACTGFGDFFTGRSNLLVIFANSSFKGVFCKLCTFLKIKLYNQQLMNEAEYLIKNYGDRGGCYPSRP